MIIRKRFERLVNLENYDSKTKFENIKIGTEVEDELQFTPGMTGPEKLAKIKSKGLALGSVAQTITEEEIKKITDKIKEAANVGK